MADTHLVRWRVMKAANALKVIGGGVRGMEGRVQRVRALETSLIISARLSDSEHVGSWQHIMKQYRREYKVYPAVDRSAPE